jgi:ribosomal protein S15P/S13E
MATQQKQSGRGLNKKKSKRQTRNKNYYGAQFYQTEKNKRRNMKRHLRRNPNDKQTARQLAELV